MKIRLVFLAALAGTVFAQTKWPNELTVWFADGTAIDIHTESSGVNSPLSTSGSVAVGAGNDSHRVVLNKEGKVLFAYDIEARKAGQGTIMMKIKPVDQDWIRKESWFNRHKIPGDIPTLKGVREFAPLRNGDTVEVDILFHPATGEKIFDVLRVSNERPPSEKPRRLPGEQFSLQEVRLTVGGKVVREARNTWMIGRALMVYLPQYGAFYLSIEPSPGVPMQASGWADHSILRFHAGEELVEIIGKSNVLQKSEYGTIWVYHEPASRQRAASAEQLREKLAEARKVYTARHPSVLALEKQMASEDRAVELTCGDDIPSLLQMHKRK